MNHYAEDRDIVPYLCGPITNCNDAEAAGWRNRFSEVFPSALDPMRRDYRRANALRDHLREIVELDKRDIRASDVLLVGWNGDKPSVGTSMEIMYAWTLGIPVVTWMQPGAQRLVWLEYHSTIIVESFEDAVAAVRRVGRVQ